MISFPASGRMSVSHKTSSPLAPRFRSAAAPDPFARRKAELEEQERIQTQQANMELQKKANTLLQSDVLAGISYGSLLSKIFAEQNPSKTLTWKKPVQSLKTMMQKLRSQNQQPKVRLQGFLDKHVHPNDQATITTAITKLYQQGLIQAGFTTSRSSIALGDLDDWLQGRQSRPYLFTIAEVQITVTDLGRQLAAKYSSDPASETSPPIPEKSLD